MHSDTVDDKAMINAHMLRQTISHFFPNIPKQKRMCGHNCYCVTKTERLGQQRSNHRANCHQVSTPAAVQRGIEGFFFFCSTHSSVLETGLREDVVKDPLP